MKNLILATALLILSVSTAMAYQYEADIIPWSGHWWPKAGDSLMTGSDYRGYPGALPKYDYATTGNYDGEATEYGYGHYYDTTAKSWEGYCFNWASASILYPEPLHIGIYNNVDFHPGDIEALLTVLQIKTLSRYLTIAGPADFHELLYNYIANRHLPFVVDLAGADEVWTFPLYGFDISETRDGDRVHFATTIYFATYALPDFTGTITLRETYYYYFDLDGETIVASDWEGESVDSHPKHGFEILGPDCRNPGIDVATVLAMAAAVDDPYEVNNSLDQAADLPCGLNRLVSADDDYYRIAVQPGDRVLLDFSSDDDSRFTVNIYDASYSLLQTLQPAETFEYSASGQGALIIGVTRSGYDEEMSYVLTVDHRLAYTYYYPQAPRDPWWDGLALVAPDGADRTFTSLLEYNGSLAASYTKAPLRTYNVGLAMQDFKLSSRYSAYMKVSSDTPLIGMQAVAMGDDFLQGSNILDRARSSSSLFIPFLCNTDGWQAVATFINTSDEDQEVALTRYDDAGQAYGTETVTLAPGELILRYTATLAPARSLHAVVTSGADALVGAMTVYNSTPELFGQGTFTLPLDKASTLYMPHNATNDWDSILAVGNPGDSAAELTFTAYDATGGVIGTAFRTLGAHQYIKAPAADIFGLQAASLSWVRIDASAGQEVSAFVLYSSQDLYQLGGAPVSAQARDSIYIAHVAHDIWWNGFAVTNVGSEPVVMTMTVYNAAGDVLDTLQKVMGAGVKFTDLVRNVFPGVMDDIAYMRFEGPPGSKLSGVWVFGANNGTRLISDILQ